MKQALLIALSALPLALAQTDSTNRPPFEQTIAWSQQSVEEARTELQTAREEIAAAQRPMLQELNRIQSELTTQRREQAQLSSETEGIKLSIERLESAVKAKATHQQNIQNRLLLVRRKLDENLHLIERPIFKEQLLSIEQTPSPDASERLERLQALMSIANTAIERLDKQTGGSRYPAETLVESISSQGTVLQLGPYAFFVSDAGDAGLVVESDNLTTRIRAHNSGTVDAILELATGGSATLPFDPLLDQAFLNADAKVTLWQHLKSGGIWIIPITFFGLVSALIALLKIKQIRGLRIPEKEQVAALVATEDDTAFEKALQQITPQARPIFAEGHAYRKAPETARTAAMSQALLEFRHYVESRLSLLGLTAAVAPLLGLLGTVTGMIKTFQVISLHGAGDARTLSGGISEALVTTELGLVVAIPALLAHAWLNRRARRISIETTSLAERFNKTLPQTDRAS